MRFGGEDASAQRRLRGTVASVLVLIVSSMVVGIAAGQRRGGSRINALVARVRPRTICEYHTLTRSEPTEITRGPDGALWFVEAFGRIGRITPPARVQEFRGRVLLRSPSGIVTGPDGALWFGTGYGSSGEIGRITTAGVVSAFPFVSRRGFGEGGPEPSDIAVGADGALWFVESGASAIGRMTTSGAYSEFLLRNAGALPNDIARGPDGALWFTEYYGNAIGRISVTGQITEYRVPTRASVPFAITAGPDHAMWFTESRGSKIGRITMSGKIHEYRLPRPDGGDLFGITDGPDGASWFTESSDDRIGRITTNGKINEYQVPTLQGTPSGIAAGPDHAIWFAEQYRHGFGVHSNTIGRVATRPRPGAPQRCISN